MQCLRPLKAGGFDYNGNITKNPLVAIKSLHFNCRKCLPCRLNIAKEKAIRSWHESRVCPGENMFLTLTYSDDHLKSPFLIYEDWQLFAKKLRKKAGKKLPIMVTGEYGDKNKRPHWHALIFNYFPSDAHKDRTNDRGEQLFTSKIIDDLWGYGKHDFGEVSIDSASYVARYAAKKLVHGWDGTHPYEPIHKTSSKNAIGKRWIEQYYEHTFENGLVVLPNGSKAKIPRYYIDWCKKHQPKLYYYYVTEVAPKIQKQYEEKSALEQIEYQETIRENEHGYPRPITKSNVKKRILEQKFKILQEQSKL